MSFNHIVIQNILRDKWTYLSYFLSSVFSILIFFLFLITAFHPMMDAINPDSTLGLTMVFSSFSVYLFSFVFIVYSMLAFLKKKTKSLGIFMITGASMKQIQRMIFRENMLIAAAAIVTSILLGLTISPLFLMVVKKVLDTDSFGMYFPIQAILMTLLMFSVLFLIVSKFVTRFIRKEEAIQLLKADVTQEKVIKPAPFKLAVSVIVSALTLACIKFWPSLIERLGMLFYLFMFASLLITIYFMLTQGMLFFTHRGQNSRSYLKKTNMLFVSNLQAKGNSYAHIIYLLAILLLAVFVGTSVLYSTYYNVEESTESVYPYSLQYISLPNNPAQQAEKDIAFIEGTFDQESEPYTTYYSAFKTDEKRRIGFMSNTHFNLLGDHPQVDLQKDEYYVVAGSDMTTPNTEWIKDYVSDDLKLKGVQEKLILTTTLQNVYYVVPDDIYETLPFPEYQVFAYELPNWTAKVNVIQSIEKEVETVPEEHLVASKIALYDTERFVKKMMFFIGFMLSLIFLSAAMSILYFYLQTSLEGEREKYRGIRKIGLSIKEIRSVVSRELALLIFIPFVFASGILFSALLALRNTINPVFYQMTGIGVSIFFVLFVISFMILRKVYVDKLLD